MFLASSLLFYMSPVDSHYRMVDILKQIIIIIINFNRLIFKTFYYINVHPL